MPAHLILLDFIPRTLFNDEAISVKIFQCSLSQKKKWSCFCPRHKGRVGGLRVRLHSFFTSTLDEDSWWPWRPGRVTSKKEFRYTLIMGQGGCFQKRYISCSCWNSNLGCPSPLKGRLTNLVLAVTVLTSFSDVPVSNLGRYTRFCAGTFEWGGASGLDWVRIG